MVYVVPHIAYKHGQGVICFCGTSEAETSNSFAKVPSVFFSATYNTMNDKWDHVDHNHIDDPNHEQDNIDDHNDERENDNDHLRPLLVEGIEVDVPKVKH